MKAHIESNLIKPYLIKYDPTHLKINYFHSTDTQYLLRIKIKMKTHQNQHNSQNEKINPPTFDIKIKKKQTPTQFAKIQIYIYI